MADDTGSSIFDFMGPPAALRVQRESQRGATERLGMVQAETEKGRLREQGILDAANNKWQEILQSGPRDINRSLQDFAQTPEFFALGPVTGGKYTDIIRSLQTNPNAPITLSPGQGAFREDPATGRLNPTPEASMPLTPSQLATTRRPESAIEKQRAETLNKLFQDGLNARGEIQTLGALRQRLESFHEDFPAGTWQGLAAQYGIDVGPRTTDIQIISALIDRLTPAQRQGLPGAASDRDVAIFRGSLPSLIRTKEGNLEILSNLEALAEGRRMAGEIAGRADPEDFGAAAWAELQRLPDPFQAARRGRQDAELRWLQETHGVDPTLMQPRSVSQLQALTNAVIQSAGGAANVPPRAKRLLQRLADQIDAEGK